jgi:hypothetical protein
MIAKGTAHNNGAKLARYITTGKGDNERAELWQLRGFGADNIKDAFRDVHVMAEGTRCKQPFLHVQVRNPEGENLSREQWERVADRIESKLGLSGQPRAIAFHTNLETGHEHMHLAISRIDQDTLKAIPLPFFKNRLKEACRELEIELGLTRVKNERDGAIKYAPTRSEEEQSRRLGMNIYDIRNTIRDCYDRSDCGRSFEAALAREGLLLARGDQRDYVVLDPQGGMHALGKRVLGVSAKETRAKLSDLVREHMPTVEQVRAHLAEQQREGDRPKPVPFRDPYCTELRWQDDLAKAAIEKEKAERRFLEPGQGRTRAEGSGEKEKGIGKELRAERVWTSFEEAKRETENEARPDKLRGPAAEIWKAWNNSANAKAFRDALDEKGIALARVTKDEAALSHRKAEFAREVGNYAPRYREGELVVVTKPGLLRLCDGEYREPNRVHRIEQSLAQRFILAYDADQIKGIETTKQALQERAQQRSADWQKIRLENAMKPRWAPKSIGNEIKILPRRFDRSAFRTVGKLLDVFSAGFESLVTPVMTPEQKRDAAEAKNQRSADAADKIDLYRYLADQEQERRQEQERSNTQRRDRGGRDR